VPFLGIAFGIISLVFGIVQKKKPTHGWGKIAVILSVIGIILSLVIWIVAATILTKYLGQVYSQNGIN